MQEIKMLKPDKLPTIFPYEQNALMYFASASKLTEVTRASPILPLL